MVLDIFPKVEKENWFDLVKSHKDKFLLVLIICMSVNYMLYYYIDVCKVKWVWVLDYDKCIFQPISCLLDLAIVVQYIYLIQLLKPLSKKRRRTIQIHLHQTCYGFFLFLILGLYMFFHVCICQSFDLGLACAVVKTHLHYRMWQIILVIISL